MGPELQDKLHRETFEDPAAAQAEARRLAQLIIVTQKKELAHLTAAHFEETNAVQPAVIASPPRAFRFSQIPLRREIHEFLLEVRKSGRVFWVGAAVPKGIKDFTRAQMYFHPFPKFVNDRDYREFKGIWNVLRENFIRLIGPQAAAAERPVPLLLPFIKQTAHKASKFGVLSNDNLFKDRPVETLHAIMTALHRLVIGKSTNVQLAKLGVASFSDGIFPMRKAIGALLSSGVIKEIFDFDSPFIVGQRRTLNFPAGPVAKCFSQKAPERPIGGYVHLREEHFSGVIEKFKKVAKNNAGIMHQRIGKMMYFQALKNSFV